MPCAGQNTALYSKEGSHSLPLGSTHRTARQRSPSSYGDVFLAPTEKNCAVLGPDSLSLTEAPHPTSKEKSK